MKRYFIALIIVVAIPVGYWLISPLFIEKKVDEKVEQIGTIEEISQITGGVFEGQGFHNAQGRVSLIKIGEKTFVRFEDDFQVTNGPDLFVHFGKDGQYDTDARLGALKGSVGGQNYEVPESIDPSEFNEVWVWCRAFSVPFARAVLN